MTEQQSLQIPKGYKQSEVGLIPDDWDVKRIGELCETASGTTPSRNLFERYYQNGSIAWVKTLDLNNSAIYATDELVTEVALKETCLRCYPIGTILVAMYGGFNQIGRTGLLKLTAAVNQAITAIKPNKNSLIPQYLLYILNYRVNYWKNVASSSRKDPNITSKDIRNFPIVKPPLPEQEKIATALSDIDALIEALEELINKKCQIKQGTMQELLTGKRRLKGFEIKQDYKQTEIGLIPDDWEVKRLGDIANIRSGGTPSTIQSHFWDGSILWCTPTDITKLNGYKYLTKTNRTITELGLKSSSAELIPAYSVVMTSRATIGECAINTVPLATNQGFKNFIPSEQINADFLYYFLQTQKQNLINLCAGSTFLEIGKTQLTTFEIYLPPNLEEQKAIAQILTDMDEEITELEERLKKTRQIKQGMMQELLTGRIRL